MGRRYIFTPRIIRSPDTDCWGKELETAIAAYTDEYLAEISEQGLDGIWVHVMLRETVRSSLFPKVSRKPTDLLNRLAERAEKYGVKVYVYLLEPRAFRAQHPFWKAHPGLKGQPTVFRGSGPKYNGTYYAMCTSAPEVLGFLEESCARLFQSVPGLGGTFLITASEFHTHCYSHFNKYADPDKTKREFICPRCVERDPSEVVAELITTIHRGVKATSKDARAIAWTWSWSIVEPDPQQKLISLLPKDTIIMSDWERGGCKRVLGKKYPVDEYSFSSLGPSERFMGHLKCARDRGMRVMAKIQIGTTHELASVPYLPLPMILAEKMELMRKHRIDGYLGCWNFGGELSEMTKIAGRMSSSPALSAQAGVNWLAKKEFGSTSAREVVRAWKHFARGWRQYPFSMTVVYRGPMNYAPAYPFFLPGHEGSPKRKALPSHLPQPRDRKGRLSFLRDNEWTLPFGSELLVAAFRKLLKEWNEGIGILQRALRKEPDNANLQREFSLARHVAFSLQSTIDIALFHDIIGKIRERKGETNRRLAQQLRKMLEQELEIARKDRELLTSDHRLGYHPEAFVHLFTAKDLEHKARVLKQSLAHIDQFVNSLAE